MLHQSIKDNSGFTFIDLAFIVVILSMIAVGLLTSDIDVTGMRKEKVTMDRLDRIKKNMARYVKTYGHYPCPAKGDLLITNANFGIAQGTQTGTCINYNLTSTDADPDEVRIGVLPVRTLNMHPDDMFDGWGRRIMYAVSEKLTATSNYNMDNSNILVLRSYDTNFAPTSQPSANITSSTAAYMIISYGKDGVGAFNKAGSSTRIQPIGLGGFNYADTVEQLNNHHMYTTSNLPVNITAIDRAFVKPGSPLTTSSAKKQFDDFMVYDEKYKTTYIKTFGGSNNDILYAASPTTDSGYLVAGETASYGVGTDGFIAKYDMLGNLSWSRNIGTADYETFRAVAQTSDGGVIAVGYKNNPNYLGIVVKLRSDLTLDWAKTIGAAGNNNLYSVAVTSNAYYVAGINGVIKFNTNGTVAWNTKVNEGTFRSVIIASDNYIIAAGSTSTYGTGGDCFFVKLNPTTGAITNSRYFGGATADDCTSVVEADDGGLLLSGTTNSDNILAVKISTAWGTMDWKKEITLGTWDSVYGTSAKTWDGHYVIAGETDAVFPMEGFVMKLNKTTGNMVWARTAGQADIDGFYGGVVKAADNGLLAIGDSLNGNYDFLIDKIDSMGNLEFTCGNAAAAMPTLTDPTITLNTPSPTTAAGPSVNNFVPTISTPSPTVAGICVAS